MQVGPADERPRLRARAAGRQRGGAGRLSRHPARHVRRGPRGDRRGPLRRRARCAAQQIMTSCPSKYEAEGREQAAPDAMAELGRLADLPRAAGRARLRVGRVDRGRLAPARRPRPLGRARGLRGLRPRRARRRRILLRALLQPRLLARVRRRLLVAARCRSIHRRGAVGRPEGLAALLGASS